jgi:hypothetical protein
MILKTAGRMVDMASGGLTVHRKKEKYWTNFKTTVATPNPVSVTTNMPAGQSLFIDWGDGTADEVIGTGSNVLSQHTYDPFIVGTSIRIKYDRNIKNIVYFQIGSHYLEGEHPRVDGFKSLETIVLKTNYLSGLIHGFSGCSSLLNVFSFGNQFTAISEDAFEGLTNLREIWLNGGQLSGDIPSLSGLDSLNVANFYSNNLTGFAGGMVASGVSFNVSNNLLTQAAVDLILSDAVVAGMGSGDTIRVDGTGNSAPSAQGYADRDTLVANGASVYVN